MSDVAKACGVSPMTVSYVLNKKGGVGAETQKRVQEAIEKMGYAPNPHAAKLSRSRQKKGGAITKNIGCILGLAANKYSDFYYGEILEAFEEELVARGFHMVFAYRWDQLQEDSVLRNTMMAPSLVDGVILLGMDEASCTLLSEHNRPLVAVDSEAPGTINNLISDHFDGGLIATKHLLDLGHRRIVCLTHNYQSDRHGRLDGYRLALQRQGVEFDESLIVHSELSVAGGRSAMTEYLKKNEDFTAVFAHNDAVACGVLKALADHGLIVPKDVSIVGYNNDSVTEITTPELTTIAIDKRGLGRLAALEIIEKIREQNVPQRRQILPVRLVARGSTGAPR